MIKLNGHDSITYERCVQICERLKRKGFASTNVVYGIGSYTYQYVTRDTYSIACKATWVQINGTPKDIFKDPKTGDGMKKSAKGLLLVDYVDDKITLFDQVSKDQESGGLLHIVFKDGVQHNRQSFAEIKERLS